MTFVEDNAKAWSEIPQLTQLADPVPETVNGPGATLSATESLRAELPGLLRKYDIKTVLDVGCGDWNWMSHVDLSMLDSYTGWDVDEATIERNQTQFYVHNARVAFECKSVLSETQIPKVDLILARHMLIHLPNVYISQVLEKFKASGSTYLLSSTWPGTENSDKQPEGFSYRGYMERTVNLEAEPFNLPEILDSIEEPAQLGEVAGVLRSGHYLGLFAVPARSFHSRVHPATEGEDISFMDALNRFKQRVDARPEQVQQQMAQLAQGAEDRIDRLRQIRDHLREVHEIASNDDSIGTAWLLLGAQSAALDTILKHLTGEE